MQKIGPNEDGKCAVATSDERSRKKKYLVLFYYIVCE